MDLRLGCQTLRTLLKPVQRLLPFSSLHDRPRATFNLPFTHLNALALRAGFSTQHRKKHDRFLKPSNLIDALSSPNHPKSLVCNRCWDDIFSTKDWEHACLRIEAKGQASPPRVHHTASIRDIKQSAKESCSFCSMLWEYIGPDLNVKDFDAQYTLRLGPSHFESSTPLGNNTWYFVLDSISTKLRHGSWALNICAHTTESDLAAKILTARPIERDVFSAAARKHMRSWIHECAGHECCPHQDDVSLPTRVIDVRPDDSPDTPRVIDSHDGKGKYAVLSYHWGSSLLQQKLNTLSISQHMRRLEIDSLPATIRDGIAVTRALAVKYLWVDTLCIVQDLEDDKLTELAKMEEYYRNSLVAIVAASSADVSQGFLQPRQRQLSEYACALTARESWPVPFSIGNGEFGTMYLKCMGCECKHLEEAEPINQRAWTFQEQLLPARQLIFSTHTLQWRCNSLGTRNLANSNHCESSGSTDAESCSLRELSKISHEPVEALIRWLKIINIYSSRNTSVESDRLTALSSIARQYGGLLGKYYGGIWESHLLRQLRWSTSRYEEDEARVTIRYRAPSWSWASLDGCVHIEYEDPLNYQTAPLDENKPLCEVVHVETHLKNSELPYGEVTGGHIILRGRLRQGWLIRSKRSLKGPRTVIWTTDEDSTLSTAQSTYDSWANQEKYLMREVIDDYVSEWIDGPNSWMGAQHDLRGEHPPIKVACLPLFKDFGLILQSTNDGNYKRIGSFEQFVWEHDFERQASVDVKIL